MTQYFVRRLVIAMPTLLILMGLTFWLVSTAPGDPLSIKNLNPERKGIQRVNKIKSERPVFYFSLSNSEANLSIENPESWFPQIRWKGFNNQFHLWFSKIITGDWGISLRYRKPVWEVIFPPLKVSFFLSFVSSSIFLSSAIFLGASLSSPKRKVLNKPTFIVLDALYSVPLFWIAILSLSFFSKSGLLALFPSSVPPDASTLGTIHAYLLPIFCLSFPTLAYYTKLIYQNIETEGQKPYVLQGMVNGNNPRSSILNDILKNALIPIVSQLPVFISGLAGGVLIIETIFNIPGLGRLLVDSFSSRDYPVIFAITFLTGSFTIAGFLIMDLLLFRLAPYSRSLFQKS